MFSLEQLIFFLGFFSLFFLLLIFGETPVGIVLIGVFAIFFILFRKQLRYKNVALQKKFVFPLALVVLITFVSFFATLSIPYTVNKSIFYLFSFLCFIFFLCVDENFLSRKNIQYGFCLVGCALSFLSILFFFFPSLVRYVPSFNLLTANYGHNHASVYFLFVIPLCFQVWKEHKKNSFFILPLLLILLGLFLSFAREVIFLSGFELVFLFWKSKSSFKEKKYLLFFFPYIFWIVIFLFFALFPQFSTVEKCIAPIFRVQLCKPLNNESRPRYWSQAMQAIWKKPLFGWGGGSFPIISNEMQNNASFFSAYAHNEYLQFFAEYGVIAGVVYLFFFFQIWKEIVRDFKKNASHETLFLSLSVISLSIDAFFDYNWNYLSIWCVLLISIALILKVHARGTVSKKTGKTSQFTFWIPSAVIVGWAGVYLLSTLFWIKGNFDIAERIFPFVYWRVEEVAGTSRITSTTNNFLLSFYGNHVPILEKYLSNIENSQTKVTVLRQLLSLHPLDAVSRSMLFQVLAKEKNWKAILEELQEINRIYPGQKKWQISEENRQIIVDSSLQAANEALLSDTHLAGSIYVQLYTFFPQVAHQATFEMFIHPGNYSANEVDGVLKNISFSDLWTYSDNLKNWYISRVRQEILNHDFEPIKEQTKRIFMLGEWNRSSTWNEVSALYQTQFQTPTSSTNIMQNKKLLESWKDVLLVLEGSQDNQKVNFEYKKQLAHDFLLLGNYYLSNHDPEAAMNNYITTYHINPYISDDSVYPLFLNMSDEDNAKFFQFVQKNSEARSLIQGKVYFVIKLQLLANTAIQEQRWNDAEAYLKLLSSDLIDDYWTPAQLGNYFYLRRDEKRAKEAYDNCIASHPQRETDCNWGKKSVDEYANSYDTRYSQASLAILKYK